MNTQIYTQQEANLHTHSFYCGHGSGQIREYVRQAHRSGVRLLGFSEHCPFADERYRPTRMAFSQISAYEADVKEQQTGSDVRVLLGYECDYHRAYHHYLVDTAARTDYLIGGVHYLNRSDEADDLLLSRPLEGRDLGRYADRYCQMLQSGLFLYAVHPDAFTYSYHRWDGEAQAISRAIIECAIQVGVALEINGYGLQKRVVPTAGGFSHAYPHPLFWAIAAEFPALLSGCSSDAHWPGDVAYGITETGAIAHRNGLRLATYHVEGNTVTLK
ncbi:MAG: PHP domain-containing protein [Sphaerochaeta sp.]|jgi:histidinol-phosphatase (PHP family)|nr:PHP domain-containing protein [Sphaerochaeta sp.]